MSAPGDIIDGRFELIARAGRGGMGTVWRARDTALDREVALKEVRALDPAFVEQNTLLRERVLREARALARLSHPHVVTIHQVLQPEGAAHPWIVMELLSGRTLQDRLADGPLTPVEAARVGRQVLSALRAAHAAGIQHRDVKPANVMLCEDTRGGPGEQAGAPRAVLTDFGIAALQGSSSLTQTGEMVGSPEYMAPERIRGADGDPSSDLWSLGLVLYTAVEGVSPLRRGTTFATLAAVLDEQPPPPVRSGPLTPVLEALLVRDPAARPDAERLDAMLAEVAAGREPAPHPGDPTAQAPTLTAHTPALPPPPPAPTPSLPPQTGGADPSAPTRTDGPHASAPTAPEPASRRRASRTPVIVAAVAVAVAVVAATALVFSLREEGGAGAEGKGGGTAGGASPESGSSARDSAQDRPPSQEDPSGKPSDSPPPTGSADPIPAAGRWVAMLHSEPESSGTAARDARLAKLRETVPNASYVLSDDYASLRPGFWVFYTGPFQDGRAALAYCAERGLTDRNQCVGRFVSRYPADFDLQCYPPASAPSGTCRRD
ncbi:serine/threonine-protein kinase [Streptomyces indicus]|uniref:non-specific serine/threonine protein kinase n=1 Tax=Streptomyces indicus TaxID=417292 RepID=A0A1G8Z117_9ACTN|nr:serine/threonine-protein kinase [Streptomyces indicus]SDK08035.1 Serine/threonine protein kinase [Streptomyces indicus]